MALLSWLCCTRAQGGCPSMGMLWAGAPARAGGQCHGHCSRFVQKYCQAMGNFGRSHPSLGIGQHAEQGSSLTSGWDPPWGLHCHHASTSGGPKGAKTKASYWSLKSRIANV